MFTSTILAPMYEYCTTPAARPPSAGGGACGPGRADLHRVPAPDLARHEGAELLQRHLRARARGHAAMHPHTRERAHTNASMPSSSAAPANTRARTRAYKHTHTHEHDKHPHSLTQMGVRARTPI